jgi:uncharacterized iron-regulated protein
MTRARIAPFVLLFVAGCCSPECPPPCSVAAWPQAGTPPPSASGTAAPAPVATKPAVESPRAGEIVDHRDGARVTFDAMVDRLASASVVYAGERHDQAEHHAFQARLFAALLERWAGKPVALAMEMVQRPYQDALDAYVRGEIDEAALRERTEWAKRWGFGWEMYAPMLRLARERHVPVIAMNAPKEVTQTVARKGLDALTPEQRASLPALDLGNEAHRAFVRKAFGAHGKTMKPEAFERFYTAQVIWEETMSSAIADRLAKDGADARVFVVVGGGHVADRFGVPARADKKSGRGHLSVVLEVAPDEEPRLDERYADYTAWFVESSPPKKGDVPAPPPPAGGNP